MNRNRTSLWQLFIFLSLVSAGLLVGDSHGVWDKIRGYIETKILRLRVEHTETDKEKIATLESKIFSLEQEIELLKDENKSLRKQLGSPLPATYAFIPGYIITAEASKEDRILKIAAGSEDGVANGMPVISESILLGIVTDTTPHISIVRLLSSPKSKVAVKTSSGALGLVTGQTDDDTIDNAILDRVLQNELLKEKDTLFTSGEDGLPPNFIIGTLGAVISESRDPFKRAQVDLTVKPDSLIRIFIVKNH